MMRGSTRFDSPQRLPMLVLVVLAVSLSGCALFRGPIENPGAPRPVSRAPGNPATQGVNQNSAVPAEPAAVTPPPPVAPPPAATRQFHLGPAATALVAQAHRQAAGGDQQAAISTIERALRIEPENPLLWLELGEIHESAGRFDQAAGLGHKALQLSTGDPHAQSASWHLIAESLKARNRNGEAAEAQRRADELSAQ